MKKWNGESGAVLDMVLIMVMVCALILPVVLNSMNTAFKAGQTEERKTKEFYSADAGINAALWRIRTDGKLDWLNGKWNESVYGHDPAYESYALSSTDPINGNSVVYTIAPKWVLEDLETPNGTQKRDPAENIDVVGCYQGTGSSSGQGKYKIIIYYDGNAGGLGINRIGCWLPNGFEYVPGSSNLENVSNPVYSYLSGPAQISDYRGGHTIMWNFTAPVDFNLFDPAGTQKEVTFEFTPNQVSQGEFSWISDNSTANYLAWSNTKIFEVKSTATSPSGQSTTATSYNTRNDGQAFGAAIEGDYLAFGSTLMRDTNASNQTHRDRLYKETTSTVSAIPTNAQVERVFLYWSGWKCKPWTTSDPVERQVDKVACKITVNGITFSDTVSSTLTQSKAITSGGSAHGWSYSCFADITQRVKDHFKNQGVTFVGNGNYTVGHWDFTAGDTAPATGGPWYRLYGYQDVAYNYSTEITEGWTRYPLGSLRNGGKTNTTTSPYYEDYSSEDEWAYAAWSVIVVYTSPATRGRQLYRFDEFYYCDSSHPLTKVISGFVVPNLVDESDAAKITCFVGEGDAAYTGDSIKVNSNTLSDTYNPYNNVWNSQSRIAGSTVKGIDIDTFNLSQAVIGEEGTSSATVQLQTGTDCWNLVYMILSFRSKITSGGVFIYDVH